MSATRWSARLRKRKAQADTPQTKRRRTRQVARKPRHARTTTGDQRRQQRSLSTEAKDVYFVQGSRRTGTSKRKRGRDGQASVDSVPKRTKVTVKTEIHLTKSKKKKTSQKKDKPALPDDGKKRCWGFSTLAMRDYHDNVWGRPEYDSQAL